MAILAYVSCQEAKLASRKEIANLLWGHVDAKKQQASLRQAVKGLRLLQAKCGVEFLKISNRTIGLIESEIRTDVDDIRNALASGAKHAIAKAQRLVAPYFLANYDSLSADFGKWKKAEGRLVRGQLLDMAAAQMWKLRDVADPSYAALSRFMLCVNPAYEWAHQRLIEHYVAIGQTERAVKQFEDCERKLFRTFGLQPKLETKKLLSASYSSVADSPRGGLLKFSPPANRSDLHPVINVACADIHPSASEGGLMTSEYIEQIERSRGLILVQNPGSAVSGASCNSELVGVNDFEGGGQFVLKIRESKSGNKAIFQLQGRNDAEPLFVDIISFPGGMEYADRANLIRKSITAMHLKIREYYNKNTELSESPYVKYREVYDLILEFDVGSNRKALRILRNMQNGYGNTSVAKALNAPLLLQKKLFAQEYLDSAHLLVEAKKMSMDAISMDPWNMLAHRYLGFASCNLGEYAEGRQHMMVAQSLNPSDPLQAIATAEACAFSGDIANAYFYSNVAKKNSEKIPRYFYGYMANISFVAGRFEEAVDFAQKAPMAGMDYRATRIAALCQLERYSEARVEMKNCMQYIERHPEISFDTDKLQISQWLGSLNPFSDLSANNKYQEGIRKATQLC